MEERKSPRASKKTAAAASAKRTGRTSKAASAGKKAAREAGSVTPRSRWRSAGRVRVNQMERGLYRVIDLARIKPVAEVWVSEQPIPTGPGPVPVRHMLERWAMLGTFRGIGSDVDFDLLSFERNIDWNDNDKLANRDEFLKSAKAAGAHSWIEADCLTFSLSKTGRSRKK